MYSFYLKTTYIVTKSQSFLKILIQQIFLLLYFLFFSPQPNHWSELCMWYLSSFCSDISYTSHRLVITSKSSNSNIPHWSNRINNWINSISKHSLTLNYTTPSPSSSPFPHLVYIWFYFYMCYWIFLCLCLFIHLFVIFCVYVQVCAGLHRQTMISTLLEIKLQAVESCFICVLDTKP